MEHKGTARLETERLILRPFTVDDAEAMWRNYASDPEVTTYLTWREHASADDSRALLTDWAACYEKPDYYQWALELREAGEVVGSLSVVRWNLEADDAELGWCLGRRWWGRGLMPEAAAAVLRFLFEEVGAQRVTARHDAENLKSGRVMQKLGMTREGMLRRHARNNRGVVDEVVYGILREEYEAGKAPLPRPVRL